MTTSLPLDISIIIVTYNSANVIGNCLDSIATHSTGMHVETLVIDNDSTDGTPALVQQDYPWARLISGHGNVGFAQGNNIGFTQAQGRYLFMLNPDTEIHPGALQALLTYADAHLQVGMIAPHVVYPDGRLQHNTFHFPDYAQAFYGFFEKLVPLDSPQNGRYLPTEYNHERETEHILGAAVFIRREVYEQLGGMDEAYQLYFEETDWCYRIRRAGWQIRYTPTATIMHISAHTTSKNPERSSILFARSQAYFYRKNYGWIAYLILKKITVIGLTYWQARTLYGLLRRRISGEIFKRRLKSYWQILLA